MAISWKEKDLRLIRLIEKPPCRVYRMDFAELSPPEQVFLALWELEAEVNNGGFWQYFWNSSGCNVPHIIRALRAIGADQAAAIVGRAIPLAGKVEWGDDDRRRQAIDKLSPETRDRLYELSKLFFAYPDDLTALLYSYICRHREQVRAPASMFSRRLANARLRRWRVATGPSRRLRRRRFYAAAMASIRSA